MAEYLREYKVVGNVEGAYGTLFSLETLDESRYTEICKIEKTFASGTIYEGTGLPAGDILLVVSSAPVYIHINGSASKTFLLGSFFVCDAPFTSVSVSVNPTGAPAHVLFVSITKE